MPWILWGIARYYSPVRLGTFIFHSFLSILISQRLGSALPSQVDFLWKAGTNLITPRYFPGKCFVLVLISSFCLRRRVKCASLYALSALQFAHAQKLACVRDLICKVPISCDCSEFLEGVFFPIPWSLKILNSSFYSLFSADLWKRASICYLEIVYTRRVRVSKKSKMYHFLNICNWTVNG